jgi:hypothetical protein
MIIIWSITCVFTKILRILVDIEIILAYLRIEIYKKSIRSSFCQKMIPKICVKNTWP